MLAATLGRFDEAAVHFERALARSATAGIPWRVLAQREYARMLLTRGEAGDRDTAMTLIDGALETAREHGMTRAVEQLLALRLDAHGLRAADQLSSVEVVAASVKDTRPDLAPAAGPDGTLTIMFSDVQDSASLVEMLGDRRWLEILQGHNAIVRREVIKHGGFEVKAQGDGFMVAFSNPQRAVECAVAVQRAFAAARANGLAEEPIHVRIGLHTGEVIRDRDDFFGITVVLAARIAAHAGPDEVLVSAATARLVAHDRREQWFDAGRALELKGLSGEHRVYAALWRELPETPTPGRAEELML
jgi:class 3 adenylate cyclase